MRERARRLRSGTAARSAWLWLGVALLIIAVLGLLSARSPAPPAALSPRDASSTGGLALYLWLERLGYVLSDSSSSTPSLASVPAPGSTVVLTPAGDLTTAEAREALRWVRRGGRLVIATDGNGDSNALAAAGFRVVAAPSASVVMWQPVLRRPPAARVSGSADTVVVDVPPGADAAGTRYGAVLVRRRLGRGEVWALTAPTLLDNAGLRRAQNRYVALNLAGPRASRVIFDEFSPPVPAPSSGWLTSTVWGVLVLFLVAVGVLYRWLAGRRLGPPVVPLRDQHRAATEYVLSLARLLERGHKRAETLATYQQELRRTLLERLGASGLDSLSHARRGEIEGLLSPPAKLSDRELLRRAAEIVQCEQDVRSRRV